MPAGSKVPPESKSFCMNLFRGRIVFDQAFPFPLNLSEDRRETLQMIIGPTEKYLEEVNDPFKNDKNASIPMEQLKKFAELGAFGAVVPEVIIFWLSSCNFREFRSTKALVLEIFKWLDWLNWLDSTIWAWALLWVGYF
jgi:hypothetical protein